MRNLLPSGTSGSAGAASRRWQSWLATLAQGRRRGRRSVVPPVEPPTAPVPTVTASNLALNWTVEGVIKMLHVKLQVGGLNLVEFASFKLRTQLLPYGQPGDPYADQGTITVFSPTLLHWDYSAVEDEVYQFELTVSAVNGSVVVTQEARNVGAHS